MKKIYSKPQIEFESFLMSTNIAAGCEKTTNTHSGYDGCGVDFSGLKVFMNDMDGCVDIKIDYVGGDGEWNEICYHVFTSGKNLFNS